MHKASNGQADFAAMLKDNEELDTEGDWLEVQGVVLVDTRIDAVVLARVLKIANTVTLPCLEK